MKWVIAILSCSSLIGFVWNGMGLYFGKNADTSKLYILGLRQSCLLSAVAMLLFVGYSVYRVANGG